MTSILKTDDESDENNDEQREIEKVTLKTPNLIKHISTESKANELENKKSAEEEEAGLVKRLEASSKEMIKGSLILNYFKASKRSFSLIFLILSFLLAQMCASGADIFVSHW